MFYINKKLVKGFLFIERKKQQNFFKNRIISDFIWKYCTDLRLILENVFQL